MKKQELLDILHTNIIKLLNETENGYSMRGLSTAIERSEGYIQKMLVGKFTPSLDTLIDISNYFDIPVWALLIDGKFSCQLIQHINTQLFLLPKESLTLVLELVTLLNKVKY
ncbi:MAG: helix-turn-helix transcriptional regulator [Lachnospiraceae bacterium]|jgi:hypothetical protein|nr:helix-turn-helix transcriptional regulator [Lachnospiraceae bacterium]